MRDHRDVLERGLREFHAPELPYEAILQRRDRRRRNKRIAAGVVGLGIGIAAILVGASVIRADKTTPANPEPPLKHNGVIAIPDGDALTLFDPHTGISSQLSLRTGRGAGLAGSPGRPMARSSRIRPGSGKARYVCSTSRRAGSQRSCPVESRLPVRDACR